MVQHGSLVNYSTHIARQFDLASGNGGLIATSICFDLVLTGLYPVLLAGRQVTLSPDAQDMNALAQTLKQGTEFAPVKLTPSHLRAIEQLAAPGELQKHVRVIALGGEPLNASALEPWREYLPTTRIFNHYGPTETTIGCLVHEVTTDDLNGDAIPIGRPISNVRIYVLDEDLQPVSIGVVGELYVGGVALARGYLNAPGLTAEKFVADPFGQSGGRLYRTGDQVRYLANGRVQFLGRIDDQVKMRGFRIELREIERAILRHESVEQAAVVVREDAPGAQRLVAYVVGKEKDWSGADELRAFLKEGLPSYMLPSAFVRMDSLPLTANGKLNRKALPAPENPHSNVYIAPENETQERLAKMWAELLAAEKVGITDNFFELGGHSLMVVQVVSRVREEFGVELAVRTLFELPTVKTLSEHVISQVASIESQRNAVTSNEQQLEEGWV
jgi:acyl-coenzyme A synthetase/AMP-(fatty) acid ligase/acyl carrier protein